MLMPPIFSGCEHRGKVRDMRYDGETGLIGTLSTDGFVKIWDANEMRVRDSVQLRYTEETCCLALDDMHHVYAVGSANNISLIDPRVGKVVHAFESCDDGWGV